MWPSLTDHLEPLCIMGITAIPRAVLSAGLGGHVTWDIWYSGSTPEWGCAIGYLGTIILVSLLAICWVAANITTACVTVLWIGAL